MKSFKDKTKWPLFKLSLTAVALDMFLSHFGEIQNDAGDKFGIDIV